MKEYERIRYEIPEPGIARVVLDRDEKRNAQDKKMLYEINDAFNQACWDDDIKVIVLASDGKDFSSGHELGVSFNSPMGDPIGTWGGSRSPGAEGGLGTEQEIFVNLCWRWRNIPKPMIAQVQGRVIAGGLMLVWPCDLIVASDDAKFSDPTVAFGLNGHEFFVHVWELGARRAKELLFTGGSISAEEAHAIGMVTRVVPREDLESATMELARTIAQQPMIGLKLAKQAVNQSQDAQGIWTAVQAGYSLHLAAHTHAMVVHGGKPIDRDGKRKIRELSGAAQP